MMSDATEYALFRLTKGDRKAAEKRLADLKESKQVAEYLELTVALEDGTSVREAQEAPKP